MSILVDINTKVDIGNSCAWELQEHWVPIIPVVHTPPPNHVLKFKLSTANPLFSLRVTVINSAFRNKDTIKWGVIRAFAFDQYSERWEWQVVSSTLFCSWWQIGWDKRKMYGPSAPLCLYPCLFQPMGLAFVSPLPSCFWFCCFWH